MLRWLRFPPQQNPPPQRWAQTQEINRSRAELRSLYSCEVSAEAVCFPAAAPAAWYSTVTTPAQQDPARTAKVQGECVVVLSSRSLQQLPAAACLAAKRGYWGIENPPAGGHYRLDVSALEDKSRVRNRNNVLVLGLFRRLTVSLFCHWAKRVRHGRDATLPDFFAAMDAEGRRRAFSLISAKCPSWLSPP